jgi:hypothetical protein
MELIARGKLDYQVNTHWLGDVVNYNEVELLVLMHELYAADASLCRCTTCTEDVYALTLNKVAPRYIQASSVRMYTAGVAKQAQLELRAAMMEAISKVKASPNH